MWGNRYWGTYWGGRYWGPVVSVGPPGIPPDLELNLRIFRSLPVNSTVSRTATLDSDMPRGISFDTEVS